MKNLIGFLGAAAVAVGMTVTAHAALYDTWTVNAAIPDGNVAGWSDTRTVSGLDSVITDVDVVLNITGGYNGDLYGYLVHSDGFAVLLDRVGSGSGDEPQFTFGFSTTGFGAITLDDGTTYGNIHDQLDPTLLDKTWKSDGLTLNDFNGLNPNGTWTLFLADLSGGGDISALVSWGLDIEAVPEPTTWALIIFAGLAGGVGLGRWVQRRVRSASTEGTTL